MLAVAAALHAMDTSETPSAQRKKGKQAVLQTQHGQLKLSGKRGSRTSKQLQRKMKKADKVRACSSRAGHGHRVLLDVLGLAHSLAFWSAATANVQRLLARLLARLLTTNRNAPCLALSRPPLTVQAAAVAERSAEKVTGKVGKKQRRLALRAVYA